MATITVSSTVEIVKTRQARVSDFSRREIPSLGWSAVTNIWCHTSDHGSKNGNQGTVFDFDLMPEEMADFKAELDALISRLKEKYRRRRKEIP
jgi:hypothetical protein